MLINTLTPRFSLPSAQDVTTLEQLTAQERKILLMTLNELSCKEIAQALCITPETAKRHRKNIIRKLQVKGKTEFRRLLYHWVSTARSLPLN